MPEEKKSEGRIVGIVSNIKGSPRDGEERYAVVSESGKVASISSRTKLDLYDKVEFPYSTEGAFSHGHVRVIEKGAEGEYRRMIKKIVDGSGIDGRVKEMGKRPDRSPLDPIAKSMLGKLGAAAKDMVRSFASGAPIVVRFHRDGDGSAGAIGLYKSLLKLREGLFLGDNEVRWRAQKGVSYDMESFYMDSLFFNEHSGVERPVLCIIDFGTTEESNEAIAKAGEVSKIIWLEHHTIIDGFGGKALEHYINPIGFGGTADFAAGALACIFGEILSGADLKDMSEAALISDFSAYGDVKNRRANEDATILDFVTGIKDSTHYLDGPITPSYLLKLLDDRERRDSVYNYANEMIDDAINLGMEKRRSYSGRDGIAVNVMDFEHVAKKYSGYLLPGRYSSKLQGRLEERSKAGTVTIVTFKNIISVRVSKRIAEKIGLLGIIERFKDETDFVDSGGGHREAASIWVSDEGKELVLKLLLKELGVEEQTA